MSNQDALRALLAGRERLVPIRRLGIGGMGVVESVRDELLGRLVARKTLHRELLGRERSVARFVHEARVLAALDHPSIVPVHDLSVTNEPEGPPSLCFTMKLIDGEPLAMALARERDARSSREFLPGLIDIVLRLCDALAFAHSRRVVHCDIKPENVVVGRYGEVYVVDWGCCRILPGAPEPLESLGRESMIDAERSQTLPGTPAYMSPEQARGDREALDVTTDVFLVGALLFEALTGRPPFAAETDLGSLFLATRCETGRLREALRAATGTSELGAVVERAMQPAPADRYPSIEALRADLRRVLWGGSDFPVREFPAGTRVLEEGAPADVAYLVLSGRCEVRKQGAAAAIRTIGPGEIFGEVAVIPGAVRTATVVALEDLVALEIEAKRLERELSGMKPWAALLLKTLASRFAESQREGGPGYPSGHNG